MAVTLVLAAGYVLCLALRTLYEVLKRRGRVDLENRLLFALVFLDMATLWVIWFTMAVRDPVSMHAPAALRWTGLALTLAGWGLFVGAVAQLRRLENTTVLVTTGLFALTRHPAYLGFVLWLIAWPVYQDAAVTLALAPLGIAATLFWRHTEELNLLAQFGPAYRDYRRRTPF